MPSKLRRAIDAVKDHTSLSLAFISGSSDIHVAVLKATSHDPSPAAEETLSELLFLASSSPEPAVRSISRRLSRTRNWIVAVKSLSVISRGISDAGPDFRREVLAATGEDGRRRLLDLSSFRDESGLSSPWDFTAFVRTLALYLDARLEASAAGKLFRRPRRCPVSSLKPSVLVNRIEHWQSVLNRAMGTRPTGQILAKATNNAVMETVEPHITATCSDPGAIKKVFQLALLCTKKQPSDRPTMHEVARVLSCFVAPNPPGAAKQPPLQSSLPSTLPSYINEYASLKNNAALTYCTSQSSSDAQLFLKFGEVISHTE